ncbi:MAG: hypothetical protein ACKVQU_01810 [Burkholderiales bacterium]
MREHLVPVLIWLIILAPIGLFVQQLGQVRSGAVRRLKAGLRFFCYSILPVLLYALVFFAMIGIEETTKRSIVSEGEARTLLLATGVGLAEVLLLTVVFAITTCFLRVPGKVV